MESVDTNTLEDTFGTFEHMEQVPQPSESNEPEMTAKNRKYNLRKSLAWDSAFFTSAGVLEPEELSSIMEGVESVEKHKLPGIQEEIHRSAESISTLESLESESLTLASLEADLFEDVRASIQKSSAASSVANARSIAAPAVTGIQSIRSSKKVDFVSRNKIKAKSTSNKSNVGLQGPGKMTKPVFGGPHVSQAKLAGRTPPGRIPSHPVVPSGLPKIGAGSVRPNGGPNEAKFGKPVRTLTAISNVKPDPQPTSLNMKPKSPTPLLESPFAAIQGSSASRNVKTCPGKSPKVQNRISPKTVGKSQLNAEKIESEGCDVGICDSETKGSAYRLDMKVTPINGGLNTSDSGTISYIVNINPGQKVGEDAIYDLHNPKYDLHLNNNSTYEKEKLNFEDQVDGLSRQVGSIDINKEIQNNLIGDSLSRLHAGSKDDSDSLELSSQRELHDFSQQDENLKCSSKPTPSLSPNMFEVTVNPRIPFSVKDSYCNMDGLFDVSTGSTVVKEAEKTPNLTLLESSLKENS